MILIFVVKAQVRKRISSYINNLHRKWHKDLYGIIDTIINKAMLLWNFSLSGVQNCHNHDTRINVKILFDPDPDDMTDTETPPREKDEDVVHYIEWLSEWRDKIRKTVLPEPNTFQEPQAHEDDVSCNLVGVCKERGLQVIVSLQEIELSPEEPEFTVKEWSVDGQIVCGINSKYYFRKDHLQLLFISEF